MLQTKPITPGLVAAAFAVSENIIKKNPTKAREIEALYNDWIGKMAPPANGHAKQLECQILRQ